VAAGDTLLAYVRNTGNESYTVTSPNQVTCNLTWTQVLPAVGGPTWANHHNLFMVANAPAGTNCTFLTTRLTGSGVLATFLQYSGVSSLSAAQNLGPFAAGVSCPTLTFPSSADIAGGLTEIPAGSVITSAFSMNMGNNVSATLTLQAGMVTRATTEGLAGTVAGGAVSKVTERAITAAGTFTMATTSVTVTSGTPYCSNEGIALMPPVTGGRDAIAADQMHSVLLNSTTSAAYSLPNTVLNSATNQGFCAWMMPTGPATNIYQIVPDSGTQLNGGTTAITKPSWQMARICQDSSGHWWADPPLRAGTNITITPSATGIEISAASGGGTTPTGGMEKIVWGTVNLGNGTQAVAANSCISTLPNNQVITGGTLGSVQASDVISWSRQSVAPPQNGWGNGALSVWPEPFAGSIGWWVCNSSNVSITPNALPVNWYVAR
jgi:hypothetical protein